VIEVPSSVRLDPPPHPSRPRRRRTDDPLKEADWARFRELVTGMGEDELELFVRDTAAAHWSVVTPPMSEEAFAVILRHHAAFLRNGLSKESLGALPRGPLGMSDDELEFFTPTPESKAEAEWEAKLFEAIESGEIGRGKPGRKQGKLLARASDKEIADECLIKARGNTRSAMTEFISRVKKGMSEKALKSDSADTTAERRWYAVMEAHGRTRRVRRNNFCV
jgi:hypothetical protein